MVRLGRRLPMGVRFIAELMPHPAYFRSNPASLGSDRTSVAREPVSWLPAIIAATVIGLILIRAVLIARRGDAGRVQMMPDDAFYYFVLAKHFAQTGHWSFDGVAPSTGFHPLWAYLLAAVFRLAPALDFARIYAFCVGVGCIAFGAAAWLMGRLLQQRFGSGALIGVLAMLCGGMVLDLAGMGMETPLALLAAAAAASIVVAPGRAGDRAFAFAIGLVGSLARSDFGLVPLCLTAALALHWLVSRKDAGALLRAFATLGGAALGVLVIALHAWWIAGSFLQNSIRMKAYWSSLAGYAPGPAAQLATDLIGYNACAPIRAAAGPILLLLGTLSVAVLIGTRSKHWPLPLAGGSAILGYIVLYGADSAALQPWYTASFAVPAMLMLAPACGWLFDATRPLFLRAPLWLALCLLLVGGFLGGLQPLWPYQTAMRNGGLYLRAHPELAPASAWNAGLISYFSDRPVINLDGLVNDDVFPYARDGRLDAYMRERGIAWVIDYGAMLNDENYRQRGGYEDGRLAACLEPVQTLSDHADERWLRSKLTLYRRRAACG